MGQPMAPTRPPERGLIESVQQYQGYSLEANCSCSPVVAIQGLTTLNLFLGAAVGARGVGPLGLCKILPTDAVETRLQEALPELLGQRGLTFMTSRHD